MKRCVIFCAGGFDSLIAPISQNDLVIAADGGLLHTQGLGLQPDAVLGDFDSLGYVPQNAVQFPVEKDDTDAMLAVRHGLANHCRSFLLYGTLDGPRLEHTVANFQTLQFLADRNAEGYLIGKTQMATVVKAGTVRFPAHATGYISLFCMGADAHGVTIRGLQYTLENATLSAGFPLGVSNQFVGSEAAVTVQEGSLLVLWDRSNGLPERLPKAPLA